MFPPLIRSAFHSAAAEGGPVFVSALGIFISISQIIPDDNYQLWDYKQKAAPCCRSCSGALS
jgi:hypothetical protein